MNDFLRRFTLASYLVALTFVIAPIVDVVLFICVVQLDRMAAWSLVPYLLYRVYAVWWGYGLWKLNCRVA